MAKLKIILFALALGACSPKVLTNERTIRDSVIYTTVEKEVLLPAYSATSHPINLDSLATLLRQGVDPKIIERTLVREDPKTKQRVGILIDSLGNLIAVCDQQERMIKVLLEERQLLRKEFERVVVQERENVFEKLWEYVRNTLFLIGAVLLLGLGLKFLK